jgi:chromosome segregation ATPase
MSDMSGVDPPEGSKKHRNPWMWASIALALIAAGLLVWALTTQSDLNDAEKEADELQSQVDQGKETGSAVLTEGKAAYDDLSQELGATSEDLDATEKDLEEAQKNVAKAEQDAAAAEQDAAQADSEADKAQAETEKAQAEAEAAESKAAVVTDCAKAYISALGALFEGDSVSAQAEVVKQQLESISATCKAAFEGA